MPVHKHTRASLGELGDRAADEETRLIVSELGVVANLRVTCRLHSKRQLLNQVSSCVLARWLRRGELKGTWARTTPLAAVAAPTKCLLNGLWVLPTGSGGSKWL